MKYLVKDLYVEWFYGRTYEHNIDKFIVGYYNIPKTKMMDVITKQVIKGEDFLPLSRLRSSKRDEGNDMALGYMTGLKADNASIYQHILAKKIDMMLSGDVIDTKQIAKIKDIMNGQIIKAHDKEVKKQEQKEIKYKKLHQFEISESEKDF